MPIYEINRKEINYTYLFVEADNQEDAERIASEVPEWKDTQKWEDELISTLEITAKDTTGKYVETENGHYRIGIDKKP